MVIVVIKTPDGMKQPHRHNTELIIFIQQTRHRGLNLHIQESTKLTVMNQQLNNYYLGGNQVLKV